MSIPGAMVALGVGDAGPMCIPGAMEPVGGDGLGDIVMPGIGAIVGAGEGFAAAGVGVLFFAGAGVAMGMPGIGAIVGCAARPGETVRTVKIAATLKRVASKQTSRWAGDILRTVVCRTPNAGFRPAVSPKPTRARYIFIVACGPWSFTWALNQAWIADTSAGSPVAYVIRAPLETSA